MSFVGAVLTSICVMVVPDGCMLFPSYLKPGEAP